MSIARLVDQTLSLARAQLALASASSLSKYAELSVKQAVILQLDLALNLYAAEVAGYQGGEDRAFSKLMAANKPMDFRADELCLSAQVPNRWVSKLVRLFGSMFTAPKTTPAFGVGANLIASSSIGLEPLDWREISFEDLEEILNSAQEMIARHRDTSAEN